MSGIECVTTTVRPEVRVVLEGDADGWSAYAPSVPVVVATGLTRDEVEHTVQSAIAAHLALLHDEAIAEGAAEVAGTSPTA